VPLLQIQKDRSNSYRCGWPFARGRGVGDALVNAVIQWASAQQAPRVVLAVFDDNERARALYHPHGFIDDGGIAGIGRDASERKEPPPIDKFDGAGYS